MKKFIAILMITVGLGGCAQLSQLETDFNNLTQSTVSPANALAAANAFDALESAATLYFSYCNTNKTQTICSKANLNAVYQSGIQGRALRNQIESYVTTQTSVPLAVYNALETIVTNLQASPVSNFGAAQ
jgi:hypothetical protein